MEKKHAIIIIKENDSYLQYYDEIWKSYLFPNCKLEDEFNLDNIKKEIKNKYGIIINNLELVMDKIHKKFSEKDKIIKEYHHYFYKAEIKEIDKKDNFKYYTYEELLNDKRIQEVNSDIVSFIKEVK